MILTFYSPKGIASRLKYAQSAKGKATREAYHPVLKHRDPSIPKLDGNLVTRNTTILKRVEQPERHIEKETKTRLKLTEKTTLVNI